MISVIIPAYNCEKHIGEAIASVMKQTTTEDVELIVIDDGSADNTAGVVQSYMNQYANLSGVSGMRSISYHSNGKNLGVAETRNAGIRAAQGDYIAFLDADDWWSEDKLEKQVLFAKEKDAVLVYTGRELMHPNGRSTGKVIAVPTEVTYNRLLRTNCIPCSSVLVKTKVAREFYMCHDELHEDYILWLNILKKYGKAYGMNEPMLKSRLTRGGKSRNKWKSAKMHYGVYRYMKIPKWKAFWLFLCYALNGVKKYR